MTPQTTTASNESPSEPSEGAGALGVVVTEEMIEAGVSALSLWDRGDRLEYIVADVFEAMLAVAFSSAVLKPGR